MALTTELRLSLRISMTIRLLKNPRLHAVQNPSSIKRYRIASELLRSFFVFIQEALDAAFCIKKLVLTCKERMASRANFDLHLFLGVAGFNNIAASASNSGLGVLGMNTLFHKNYLGKVELSNTYACVKLAHSCS